MAKYLVVKRVDMAELSREARAPFVEVSIDKNADTKPPTDVKKQDILLSFGTSLHEFSVRHGPAIIVDADVAAHSFAHERDRKSTRLNSSHANISYAVFCLKKKK